MAKNPFSDEVDVNATDPANLFTGSGSQMFHNEQSNEDSKRVKELESKRAEQRGQLLPVAKDLLAMLAQKKAQNADIRSFLKRIRGDEEAETVSRDEKAGRTKITRTVKAPKQLTEAEIHQMAVQAEAREMNIALIEEIERWVMGKIRSSN